MDLHELAQRFELTGGEIKNALRQAVAATVHDHGGEGPITQAYLEVAAADQLQKPAADEYGADRLECPARDGRDASSLPLWVSRLRRISLRRATAGRWWTPGVWARTSAVDSG
ncbi:MAG: hypothetical protein JXX28_03775 [Deltaproteobacteria bacterium]|nr:hypothetical protein [Deltaproteobacteria bacterium]